MSELHLTIAAAVEIGLAVLALLAVLVVKRVRRRAVVVLGALTPAIVVMVQLAYDQFINPKPGSMAAAGWVIGFAAYAFVFVGGVLLEPVRVR